MKRLFHFEYREDSSSEIRDTRRRVDFVPDAVQLPTAPSKAARRESPEMPPKQPLTFRARQKARKEAKAAAREASKKKTVTKKPVKKPSRKKPATKRS
jgi:hypothetical protein